jgi:hypothetical protein
MWNTSWNENWQWKSKNQVSVYPSEIPQDLTWMEPKPSCGKLVTTRPSYGTDLYEIMHAGMRDCMSTYVYMHYVYMYVCMYICTSTYACM